MIMETKKDIWSSKAYKQLSNRIEKKDIVSGYIQKLKLLEKYLNGEYKLLSVFFDKYTNHGWEHTIKVLDYMYDLVFKPEELTEEELMLMIYVAVLHDIGMAWSEKKAKEIISENVLAREIAKYKRTKNNPDNAFKDCAREIIRAQHGDFSSLKIKEIPKKQKPKSFDDIFKLCSGNTDVDNWNLTDVIANICKSHMKSANWIQREIKENREVFIACLLRIADLVDIENTRADSFYQHSNNIDGINAEHYLLNQIVGDSEKIKDCLADTCEEKCPNRLVNEPCPKRVKRIELIITYPLNIEHEMKARINLMINDFQDAIRDEIYAVNSILNTPLFENKYHINLDSKIHCIMMNTTTNTSDKLDTHKLAVDYNAIKMLIFGDQLYRSKICGFREIIQNAYDGCKAFADLKLDKNDWEAKITIEFNSKKNILTIRDNGIGMTDFVIKEYFLNIGKSIYNNDPSYVYNGYHIDHIGHFGLGFFASFILSSRVKIRTRSYSCQNTTTIELDKDSNFAVLSHDGAMGSHGTEIILNYSDLQTALGQKSKEECLKLLIEYILYTFIHDGITFRFIIDEEIKKSIKLLRLPIRGWDILDNYLDCINASVKISLKKMPKIFYAESQKELICIEYDDLLVKLARNCQQGQISYLDAGCFLIFSNTDLIIEDFMKAKDNIPRRNYVPNTPISESIPITIRDFCESNSLNIPTFCYYSALNFVKEGNNIALSDINIPCTKFRNIMRLNDACGEPSLDDKIFLRDVLLPSLHTVLPNLNFRYSFDELVVNIKTDNIFPTLPRDTLTKERAIELSYAIGYAIAKQKGEHGTAKIEDGLIANKLYSDIVRNVFVNGGK